MLKIVLTVFCSRHPNHAQKACSSQTSVRFLRIAGTLFAGFSQVLTLNEFLCVCKSPSDMHFFGVFTYFNSELLELDFIVHELGKRKSHSIHSVFQHRCWKILHLKSKLPCAALLHRIRLILVPYWIQTFTYPGQGDGFMSILQTSNILTNLFSF